ncbi:MAG: DUF4349 domain-containing protein [Tissierellia bacterium]|nr:DUF4349 domain-containing protein [Tissierellia bacterium]
MKRRLLYKAMMLFVALSLLVSCGTSKGDVPKDAAQLEAPYYEEPENNPDMNKDASLNEIGESSNPESVNLKIISTYNYSLVSKNINASIQKLKQFVEENGGYISNEDRNFGSEYSNQFYSATIRIPKINSTGISTLFESDANLFSISHQSKSTEEISKQYFDQEVRLRVLEAKLARLQEIATQQGEMDKLLSVESEISNTIMSIEDIKGNLRYMDDKVAMDTVYVEISEKTAIGSVNQADKKDPFGTRIADAFTSMWIGFVDFIQNFILVIIALLPVIIILAAIIIIVIVLVRRNSKAKRNYVDKINYPRNNDNNGPGNTTNQS